jgi:hypothetical protein
MCDVLQNLSKYIQRLSGIFWYQSVRWKDCGHNFHFQSYARVYFKWDMWELQLLFPLVTVSALVLVLWGCKFLKTKLRLYNL